MLDLESVELCTLEQFTRPSMTRRLASFTVEYGSCRRLEHGPQSFARLRWALDVRIGSNAARELGRLVGADQQGGVDGRLVVGGVVGRRCRDRGRDRATAAVVVALGRGGAKVFLRADEHERFAGTEVRHLGQPLLGDVRQRVAVRHTEADQDHIGVRVRQRSEDKTKYYHGITSYTHREYDYARLVWIAVEKQCVCCSWIFFPVKQFDICCFRSAMKGFLAITWLWTS